MFHQQLTAVADHLTAVLARLPLNQRYLVSLSGVPGSGKSTWCQTLVPYLDRALGHDLAIVVPMDGFHWSRKKLGTFPDPEEAIRRRGAPGTFDAQGLLELIKATRAPITPSKNSIMAPTFDHYHKDPRPDTLAITSRHRIVIFEGLYLQLASVPIWQDIPPLMDEAWWIECPLAICRTRIIQRHVDSGISPDHDAATVQTDGNDLCNAQFILDHRIPTVDRVIEQLTVGADGSLVASLN